MHKFYLHHMSDDNHRRKINNCDIYQQFACSLQLNKNHLLSERLSVLILR